MFVQMFFGKRCFATSRLYSFTNSKILHVAFFLESTSLQKFSNFAKVQLVTRDDLVFLHQKEKHFLYDFNHVIKWERAEWKGFTDQMIRARQYRK